MQLNELRLVSETEFNQWRASWDGVTKPPEEMLNYFFKVQEVRRHATMNKLVKDFLNAN